MNVQSKPGFKYDIAILRLLSIATVVAFHGYGMTMVHFSDETNGLFNNLYYMINQAGLINIAMPLFVWISGYLFFKEINGDSCSLTKLTQKKGKRIILPYLFFTLIFMLTTNSFSLEPLYYGGYWHLWFLPMLMWCFILSWCIRKLVISRNVLLQLAFGIILFSVVFLPFNLPSVFGLNGLKNWFCWFYIGMLSFNYDEPIMRFFRKSHIPWLLAMICIVIMFTHPTLYESYTWYKLLASICGIYSLWYLIRSISWQNFFFTNFLLSLSSLSFGIYIFHNWVEMHLLSHSIQRIIPIESFASSHPYIFPILFCLISLIISILLTHWIRKTRFGRNLL